jgi:hypothetical protein
MSHASEVCCDIASPVSKVVEGAIVAGLTTTQSGFQRPAQFGPWTASKASI